MLGAVCTADGGGKDGGAAAETCFATGEDDSGDNDLDPSDDLPLMAPL